MEKGLDNDCLNTINTTGLDSQIRIAVNCIIMDNNMYYYIFIFRD